VTVAEPPSLIGPSFPSVAVGFALAMVTLNVWVSEPPSLSVIVSVTV
jgi:hypothetical protein